MSRRLGSGAWSRPSSGRDLFRVAHHRVRDVVRDRRDASARALPRHPCRHKARPDDRRVGPGSLDQQPDIWDWLSDRASDGQAGLLSVFDDGWRARDRQLTTADQLGYGVVVAASCRDRPAGVSIIRIGVLQFSGLGARNVMTPNRELGFAPPRPRRIASTSFAISLMPCFVGPRSRTCSVRTGHASTSRTRRSRLLGSSSKPWRLDDRSRLSRTIRNSRVRRLPASPGLAAAPNQAPRPWRASVSTRRHSSSNRDRGRSRVSGSS